MPRIDFSTVDSVNEFTPLPDGEYTCRLTDIEQAFASNGDPMWKLRWAVEDGDYAGRLLFDNLVFSPRALPRVKLLCASCGLDVSGEVDLEPEMLLDKRVRVRVFQQEYVDDHGVTKVRNQIPFDGYAPITDTDDETPF